MTDVTSQLSSGLNYRDGVARNCLLSSLDQADLRLLVPYLRNTVFEKGAVLLEPGQSVKDVYFPHSGFVSLMGVLPEGNSIDTAMIGRENAIGIMAGLGSTVAISRAVVQLQ